MLSYSFLTAGNATMTVEPSDKFVAARGAKPHYTYKIRHREAKGGYGEAWFVSMLTGPDNQSDYTYLGMLDAASGTVRLTSRSKLTEDSVPVEIVKRVVAALARGDGDKISAAGWKVRHEGKCGRCGRKLTEPTSLDCGIGPECRQIMGI